MKYIIYLTLKYIVQLKPKYRSNPHGTQSNISTSIVSTRRKDLVRLQIG